MAKRLTAGVLNGTAYREIMQVEWAGEEFEVEIRPLNNAEATRVEELMQEGITINAREGLKGKMVRQMAFDYKANYRGRKKADILTVALGTVDDSITEEVVEKEFPPKLVREIAQRIQKISGIGNDEEIEQLTEGGEEDPFHGGDK
ncbi:MAG: hypothetical protein C6W57_03275 [Caldibacillus debilis]|uniref:hypothetical protein n=1 Tax=Caldibacillus debilis TaxID=301148 RepID=UPI000E37C23E|nr:hypothetical protein [Caldibacillus debilis]REJ18645.1 MAG: hypothetical protein C6W57_03275 [Caldibacillus debilis]